jgi:hypothetical protein
MEWNCIRRNHGQPYNAKISGRKQLNAFIRHLWTRPLDLDLDVGRSRFAAD